MSDRDEEVQELRWTRAVAETDIGRIAGADRLSPLLEGLDQRMPDLERLIAELHGTIDDMSELGEMEALRLQMAMDRMSKLMSTLSNLLKSMSDTTQAIARNMR